MTDLKREAERILNSLSPELYVLPDTFIIEKALRSIRNQTLEEAALKAEDCDHSHSCEGPLIAKEIRDLKSKATQ